MVNSTQFTTQQIMQDSLITKEDLIEHFKQLGIRREMIVYIQAHKSYQERICGGFRALFEALQEVVRYDGTIITNSFSLYNVDPLNRSSEPYAPYQIDAVREALPCFDKKLTLSDNELANQIMRHDGVFRSYHPTHSFVSWGKYAKVFCDKQPLHFPLSSNSPLDKIANLNGFILLMGVDFKDADIFKLSRINDHKTTIKIVSSPIEKKGYKSYISFLDYDYQDIDYDGLYSLMKERQVIKETMIGDAVCQLFSARESTILATAYYHTHNN